MPGATVAVWEALAKACASLCQARTNGLVAMSTLGEHEGAPRGRNADRAAGPKRVLPGGSEPRHRRQAVAGGEVVSSNAKWSKADSGEFLELRDESGNHCGTYFVDNPYKPYLAAVFTPSGHNVVAPRAAGHRHHHGLQYGLCADDVNFWEEDLASEPEEFRVPIGWQQSEKLERLTGIEGDGLVQELSWCHETYAGTCVSFREQRRIWVSKPRPGAYEWVWETELTARRDLRLVTSAWPQAGGYCGLGLRLAPEYFFRRSSVMAVPEERRVSGAAPASVTARGPRASVTFQQDLTKQQDVLHVQGCAPASNDAYAWLGLGPTNGAALTLRRGETLRRRYHLTVSDV